MKCIEVGCMCKYWCFVLVEGWVVEMGDFGCG